MKTWNNFSSCRVAALVFAAAMALTLVACDSMQSKASSSAMQGDQSMQAMIDMAMQNMGKVMMMSPSERQRYVMSQTQGSIDHGKALFASASLGTNGFSCATCHPGGGTTNGKVPMGNMQMGIPSLKGAAATFPKFKPGNNAVITLPDMNNNCIVMFEKGKPLLLDSKEARDLAAYVSTLSNNAPFMPGKQGDM